MGQGLMTQFLLKSDVARLAARTPATIRNDAKAGKLRVAARTEKGVRLFLRSDVERYLRARLEDKKWHND